MQGVALLAFQVLEATSTRTRHGQSKSTLSRFLGLFLIFLSMRRNPPSRFRAGERLDCTILSCVLVGLSRAPHMISKARSDLYPSTITAANFGALVIPADAFGSRAILSLASRADVMVTVDENITTLDVTAKFVGIDESKFVHATRYAEAAGLIAAHKAGKTILHFKRPSFHYRSIRQHRLGRTLRCPKLLRHGHRTKSIPL